MKTRTLALALALVAPTLTPACDQPDAVDLDTAESDPPAPSVSPAVSHEVALQIPGRDLRTAPPVARSVELHALPGDTGQARLEARYDEPLPSLLKFTENGAIKLLRDDGQAPDLVAGDGIYSTVVTMEVTVASIAASSLKADRTLMVTHPGVVDSSLTIDPCIATTSTDISSKYWSFGYLLSQMTGGQVPVSTFATGWLVDWSQPELNINEDLVRPYGASTGQRKVGGEVLRQWRCASGMQACCHIMPWNQETNDFLQDSDEFQACENEAGTKSLKMSKAPFRLLAIVNRLDLRGNPAFDPARGAGELRFVFSVLDLDGQDNTTKACNGMEHIQNDRPAVRAGVPRQLASTEVQAGLNTVILEYRVPARDQAAVKAWAKRWYALNSKTPGTTDYRDALRDITRSVTKSGVSPERPNGSALLRIRTNETTNEQQWQLREFEINDEGHTPTATTIKLTPSRAMASGIGDNVLAAYIRANLSAVLHETHTVPEVAFGRNVLGGETTHPGFGGFWAIGNLLINSTDEKKARHLFSLNTCNGCHGAETMTHFAHVEPRLYKQASLLSAFLQGHPFKSTAQFKVVDPTDPTITRPFHELTDRAADLAAVLNAPATAAFAFSPKGGVQ
jgi:hypothetical protein